jgi:hypothetical protein
MFSAAINSLPADQLLQLFIGVMQSQQQPFLPGLQAQVRTAAPPPESTIPALISANFPSSKSLPDMFTLVEAGTGSWTLRITNSAPWICASLTPSSARSLPMMTDLHRWLHLPHVCPPPRTIPPLRSYCTPPVVFPYPDTVCWRSTHTHPGFIMSHQLFS